MQTTESAAAKRDTNQTPDIESYTSLHVYPTESLYPMESLVRIQTGDQTRTTTQPSIVQANFARHQRPVYLSRTAGLG